jgi:phosphinothricin acetyltransferase
MSEWLSHHDAAHPVIVASVNGETLGWGSLSAWSPKGGYRTTVEASVYVAPAHHGSGIGTRLLQDLIARARSLGVHVIVARISTENRISLQLVAHCGFTPVGTMRESGFKFDRYVDVEVLQLTLDDSCI